MNSSARSPREGEYLVPVSGGTPFEETGTVPQVNEQAPRFAKACTFESQMEPPPRVSRPAEGGAGCPCTALIGAWPVKPRLSVSMLQLSVLWVAHRFGVRLRASAPYLLLRGHGGAHGRLEMMSIGDLELPVRARQVYFYRLRCYM